MRQLPNVESFTRRIRRRLNRHRFYSAMMWAGAVAVATMVAVALWYVVPGYSVPPAAYAWIGGGGFVAGLLAWAVRRVDAETAARVADEVYGLKDAVVSSRHFACSGKQGGFYDLQAAQTESQVAKLASTPSAVRYRFPYSLAAFALVLAMIAGVLGFKSPSDAVQRELAQREQMLRETAQINDELEELVDELEEEVAGTDEEELIDASELRKWVKELEETTDRKEALRQYAHLEQKLQEASARLEQRRDERLLDRAAKELARDRATKELAKQLQQKKYDNAAGELEKLKPEKRLLSKQMKELARLKAAAKRMKTGALALRRHSSSDLDEANQRAGDKANDLDDEPGADEDLSELDELIEELDEAVGEWEQALEKLELDEEELENLEDCEECRGLVEGKLDELGDKLKRLALKRKARDKLKKLCRACSQCQSGLCRNPRAGGKKAGQGTNKATRDARDELVDNGQYTQLKGIKGDGPSLAKVEAAADGDGVSTRRAAKRNRAFQRQIESFVEREDVPEDVKAGVKEYFKNIHRPEPAAVVEGADEEDAAGNSTR